MIKEGDIVVCVAAAYGLKLKAEYQIHTLFNCSCGMALCSLFDVKLNRRCYGSVCDCGLHMSGVSAWKLSRFRKVEKANTSLEEQITESLTRELQLK